MLILSSIPILCTLSISVIVFANIANALCHTKVLDYIIAFMAENCQGKMLYISKKQRPAKVGKALLSLFFISISRCILSSSDTEIAPLAAAG